MAQFIFGLILGMFLGIFLIALVKGGTGSDDK